MDQKTLEWMNEKAKKGNEIQKKISQLKSNIERVGKGNGICIGFYVNDNSNWVSEIGYGNSNNSEYRQFMYKAIVEPLITAFEKEIAELEAEFAEL